MGAIVNALAIIICGAIGLIFNTGIPERFQERLMQGIALCVLTLGISGAIQGKETIIMIMSIVIGILIGEAFDFDSLLTKSVQKLEAKVQHLDQFKNIGQGFISASLFFCVGSMAILGSLESGLTGDNTTLYTKSILDGITSILLASSLGAGVLLSSLPVLLIQGSITLFAFVLEPLLPAAVITEVICVGSILLIGLGLNMIGLTKLKILNFTPAIFLPILFMIFNH